MMNIMLCLDYLVLVLKLTIAAFDVGDREGTQAFHVQVQAYAMAAYIAGRAWVDSLTMGQMSRTAADLYMPHARMDMQSTHLSR